MQSLVSNILPISMAWDFKYIYNKYYAAYIIGKRIHEAFVSSDTSYYLTLVMQSCGIKHTRYYLWVSIGDMRLTASLRLTTRYMSWVFR